MHTPKIAELGHIGLHCHDLDRMVRFYTEVMNLTITDGDGEMGLVFLCSRPAEEHHELVLIGHRNTTPDTRLIQQISFRCGEIADIKGFYDRLKNEPDVSFDEIVSHGNAIGVYFFDPEGNKCEVYFNTGLEAKQPFKVDVDLEQSVEDIMRGVEESVKKYGATGVMHGKPLPVRS